MYNEVTIDQNPVKSLEMSDIFAYVDVGYDDTRHRFWDGFIMWISQYNEKGQNDYEKKSHGNPVVDVSSV